MVWMVSGGNIHVCGKQWCCGWAVLEIMMWVENNNGVGVQWWRI